MAKVVPISQIRARSSAIVDDVVQTHQRVAVPRMGNAPGPNWPASPRIEWWVRAVHEIDEELHMIRVVHIDHRSEFFRRR